MQAVRTSLIFLVSERLRVMLLDFLLVLLVLVCIALGAVILLQRSEGGAFGMGGNSSGLMTARGAGDLLTRTTSILAAVFFGLCLLLTILSGRMHTGESVVDRLKVDALSPDALNKSMGPRPVAAPAAAAPAKPGFDAPAPEVHTAPAAGATGGATAPPTAATDNGAHAPASNLLGYQTAPQATPTVAHKAASSTTAPAANTGQ
jgi:preprotein translocase subunit SecG